MKISVPALLAIFFAALLRPSSACGIWGQLFCDYCWDGQFTSGTDSGIANAVVTANCTVQVGTSLVYYWGTDTTSSVSSTLGYFECPVTGTSNLLGQISAEYSFMAAMFVGGKYTKGQLPTSKLLGCKVTVSNAGSCSTVSLNQGEFLTSGAQGDGWTSSNVQLARYQSTDWADIYIGANGTRQLSVAATPAARGQGAPKACPSAPPPPPGLKGDPHFTGADGSHFDFTGQPGKHYCLISDSHVHVNALYGGRYDRWGSNPRKALTWIRQLGVLWGAHTVTLEAREGASWQYGAGYMARIAVDGQEVALRAEGDSAAFAGGALEVTWLAAGLPSGDDLVDVYLVKAGTALLLRLTLRPEIALLRTEQDAVVHFDVEVPRADLSDAAHGVLGQTFRSDHRRRLRKQQVEFSELLQAEVVPGDNAEGFLDGQVGDYEEAGLLSAGSAVARFQGASTPAEGAKRAAQLTSGAAKGGPLPRALLGGTGRKGLGNLNLNLGLIGSAGGA